ncbi:MAG: hypothetical protein HA494_09260 [Thaumarchaeota archaeon]|nr:hypothetical protein [Nitrososphaerota archaeon]
MVGVVVYGFSTEGYHIASTLASQGFSVSMVDEEMQIATEITPAVAKAIRALPDLMGRDQLLSIKPVEAALSEAEYIFFAPKVRRHPEEAESEVNSRLREVAKNMMKGATLIYHLPSGLGGFEAIVTLLEKISGLTSREGFEYVYAPLKPRTIEPYCLGFLSKPKKNLFNLFSKLGFKPVTLGCGSAEALHASKILSTYSTLVPQIEVCGLLEGAERVKLGRLLGGRDVFIDTLSSQMLDLRLIASSLPSKEPLMHLASNILKIVEGFTKRVLDEVKELMKNLELKASKTKVILNWSVDRYEMRGDRLGVHQTLLERLRDYVSDVSTTSSAPWDESSSEFKIKEILAEPRIKLIISGSQTDHEALWGRLTKEHPIGEYIFIKANLVCETLSTKTSRLGGEYV